MSIKQSYPYAVEINDLNKDGILTPVGYQKTIISTTEKELRRIGLSVPEMMQKFNVTWILLALSIEVYKPIKEGSVINVTTWHTHKKGVIFRREFQITNELNEVVAVACSFSSLIDLSKRRICMDRSVYDQLNLEVGEEILTAQGKAQINGDFEFSEEIAVRPSWIDGFDHVNNYRYAELAFDNLPEEYYLKMANLCRFEIYFVGELRLGESVKVSRKMVENGVEIKGEHSSDSRSAFFAKMLFNS
jgi:acyl-ACP thioesterase